MFKTLDRFEIECAFKQNDRNLRTGIVCWCAVNSFAELHRPTPARAIARGATPTAERLEVLLHPWSSFVVVPIFAFANTGISLNDGTLANSGVTRVIGGVLFAKLIGKFVGVTGATLLAQRLGIGRLPEGIGVREVLGIGALAGIGLTVSFLVANLAFADQVRQNQAELAVLVAAVISALVATAILRRRTPTANPPRDARSK